MTPEPQSNSIARAERGDALTLPTLIDEFESDCIGAERNASNIASGGYYATEKHETKKRLVAAVSALNAELEQAKRERDMWEAEEVRRTEQRDLMERECARANAALADLTKQRDEAQYEVNRLSSQRDAAQAQAAALRKERDQLQSSTLAGAIVEENAALRQRVAELEAALRQTLASAFPSPVEQPTMARAWSHARTALAATPSSTEPRLAAPAQVSAPDAQAQAQ